MNIHKAKLLTLYYCVCLKFKEALSTFPSTLTTLVQVFCFQNVVQLHILCEEVYTHYSNYNAFDAAVQYVIKCG